MPSELLDLIERLRRMPERVDAARPKIAEELRKIVADNVAAKRGPDGTAWAPGKENSDVLRGAMKNVDVRVVGTAIVMTVRGPEARHHLGIAKGRVKREIIPTKKAPQPMIDAIKRVIGEELKK